MQAVSDQFLLHSYVLIPLQRSTLKRVFAHLNSFIPLSFSLLLKLSTRSGLCRTVRERLQDNSIRYPQFSISYCPNHKPSRSALVLAAPAHIFSLTPEQLHRIPLSHPLSVDPCSPAFHSRFNSNDLSFFLVVLIPCLTCIPTYLFRYLFASHFSRRLVFWAFTEALTT
jgi:hypothetical protein